MATIDGQSYRPLSYYSDNFPHRVINPETLDHTVQHALVMRVQDAPEARGAVEYPVILQTVRAQGLGRFALNLLFIVNRQPHGRYIGEMFDGVWEANPSIAIPTKNGQFALRDGILIDQNLPGYDIPSLTVSREHHGSLELTGV